MIRPKAERELLSEGHCQRKSACDRVGADSLPGISRPALFQYFKNQSEIIRIVVMIYIRFPLSLRNVEELLHERGIDITHERSGSGEAGTGSTALPRSAAVGSTRSLRIPSRHVARL